MSARFTCARATSSIAAVSSDLNFQDYHEKASAAICRVCDKVFLFVGTKKAFKFSTAKAHS